MSTLKVDAIRHNSATSDAITTAADGTCTAKLTSLGGGQLSHRNKIINGGIKIFQRGTSEVRSGGNDGYYNGIADRWAIRMHSSVAQTTFSKDTSSNPEGFGSNQKLVRANAGSSNAGKYFVYDTKLEGQDLQDFAKGTSGAKEFTLSFYVKTGVSGVYTCELRDLDNTRTVVKQYTVSNGNWNRYTLTFPADTTGAFGNDNGASLWVRFWLAAGTNFTSGTSQTTWASSNDANICPGQTAQVGDNVADTWQITGVQLEVGDTATSFEHRSIGEELTRCYRYYRRFGANGALPTPAPYKRFSIGYAPSNTSIRFPFQLDPPMRINPVNSNFSKSGGFSIQPGSIGSYTLNCDDNSCSVDMLVALMGNTSVTSGTGSAVSLHANNDTSAYIEISAEL
tara:strand:- start:145 stop:1332 length:1188 start_codon:yes stop_codon:yes gene_type:complete